MRFGSSETFGADKLIWAWLLRHAGWQISYGEQYAHEVVSFAEIFLVRVPKPTHRGLHGGKRWHKGDAVCIKGVWVGRSDLSDENTSFSHLEAAYFRERFDDWNLVETMLDFSMR